MGAFSKKITSIFALIFCTNFFYPQAVGIPQNQIDDEKIPKSQIENSKINENKNTGIPKENMKIPEKKSLYRLKKVPFDSKGKTKARELEKKITEINYEKIFFSKDDFEQYLHDIYQQIENSRLLKNITYSYEISEIDEEGVNLAYVKYEFYDTFSFIIFPKPTFDTNSGFEVKFKLKDVNFLGTMNDFNADVSFQLGDKDHPSDYSRVTLGLGLGYNIPFSIKKVDFEWQNNISFDWQIKEEKPEFSLETGPQISVPVGNHKLIFSFTQSIIRDKTYEPFDDTLYFVEKGAVSMPLKLGYIGNTTVVYYTPSLSFTYNWDANGINSLNTDLCKTPLLEFSQSIGVSHINWTTENNFREGYEFSAIPTLGWNFGGNSLENHFVPSVKAQLQLFKSFRFLALSANITAYAAINSTTNIGGDLRGATDRQSFCNKYEIDIFNYALTTPGAITINLEVPIHIVTTHWLDWFFALFGEYESKPKFVRILGFIPHFLFKYLDFELQINPFIDIGLLKNRATDANFSFKEGIYTGGLEVLIFPERWKKFVIRTSFGVDISKKFLDGHLGFDSTWRNPSKPWELYFGLGLQF